MGILSTLEQRAHPSNPDKWLIQALYGAPDPGPTGVTVTEDSALSATAIWAGVRIISETLAMLPLKLYERVDERSKRPARSSDLYRLMHDAPNPEQTSFEFREMQQGFLLLWGNCYAQKMVNARGEVSELWPLVPWRVTPIRTASNAMAYRVRLPGDDRREVVLSADDILHVRGFSSNGFLGDNVVEKFRNSIGLSLAAEEFGGRFFGNGLAASGGLKHPGKLGPEGRKNLRDSFTERHGGVSKSHRLMILEEGLEWFQMSTDPEKAQALETRKFQVTEVARILNLPPHLLKDLERATFTNIEHQGQEFVTYSMQPWLTRWEQRLNRSLILPSQREQYFFKFEVGGLLRGDSAARSAFYASMFNTGVYSINDIREKEDDEPVEGGDQRFVPLNMAPLEQASQLLAAPPAVDPVAEPEPRAIRPTPRIALEPVVRAEVDRIVRRQSKAIRGAARKGPQEFRAWADEFFEREVEVVVESLTPAATSLAALTGTQLDVRAFSSIDTAQALEAVRRALAAPEDLEARVGALADAWEAERAEAVTRQIIDQPAETLAQGRGE